MPSSQDKEGPQADAQCSSLTELGVCGEREEMDVFDIGTKGVSSFPKKKKGN